MIAKEGINLVCVTPLTDFYLYDSSTFPVKKSLLTAWVDEKAAQALENIRALPSRNTPLLEIICEEAADYFNGIKSAEDTAKVIENRV